MFYAKTSPEFFIISSPHGFKIDDERVPDYITPAVASDILFAVTTVSMLGSRKVCEEDVQICIEALMACAPSETDYCYAWKSVEFQSAVTNYKAVVSNVLWEKVVVGQGILDHLKVYNLTNAFRI
jgi:hypothetical protein